MAKIRRLYLLVDSELLFITYLIVIWFDLLLNISRQYNLMFKPLNLL